MSAAENQKIERYVEKYGVERVAFEDTKHWYGVGMIWVGFLVTTSDFIRAAALTPAFGFSKAALITIVGWLILFGLQLIMVNASADQRVPSLVLYRSCFGEMGSKVFLSFLMAIINLFFFALNASTAGYGLAQMLKFVFDIDLPPLLVVLVTGSIVLLVSTLGYNCMEKVNKYLVPFQLIIWVFVVFYALLFNPGLEKLLAYIPDKAGTMTWNAGIHLTAGAWGTALFLTADIGRYVRSRTDGFKALAMAIPAGVICQFTGIILVAATRNTDIFQDMYLLIGIGLGSIGVLSLIFSNWNTCFVGAYSGGLSIANIFDLSGKGRALVTGVIGGLFLIAVAIITQTMPSLIQTMVSISNFVGWILPPAVGIFVADYFILKRNIPTNSRWDSNRKGFNWVGIGVMLVSAVFAYYTTVINPFGVGIVNSFLFAILAYVICETIFNKQYLEDFTSLANSKELDNVSQQIGISNSK